MSVVAANRPYVKPSSRPVGTAPRVGVMSLVSALLWVVVLSCLLLAHSFGAIDARTTQAMIAVLGIMHSVVGFWNHGGRRISVPGVALFGTGLFAYFPALFIAFNPDGPYGHADLLQAVTLAFCAQLIIYATMWAPNNTTEATRPQDSSGVRSPAALIWAVALLAAGAVMAQTGLFGDIPIADGAAYAGVVLLSVWALRSSRPATFAYVLVAVAFVAYLEFVFSGFGRLRLGSLGLAIAILAAYRWRGRTLKAVLLAATGPAIAYMADARAEFSASITGTATETGIESVLSPMVRFGQLMDMDAANQFEHSWGSSFLTSAVAMVPRSIWPDKPIGLGAELGMLFRPELARYEHSELALLHGEFIHAFGMLGILLLIPFIGWGALLLDRLLVRAMRVGASDLLGSLSVAMCVVLAASVVDLIWGGTFTYVARTGPRLLMLGAVFVMVWAVQVAASPPAKKASPRPVRPQARR